MWIPAGVRGSDSPIPRSAVQGLHLDTSKESPHTRRCMTVPAWSGSGGALGAVAADGSAKRTVAATAAVLVFAGDESADAE